MHTRAEFGDRALESLDAVLEALFGGVTQCLMLGGRHHDEVRHLAEANAQEVGDGGKPVTIRALSVLPLADRGLVDADPVGDIALT